jgi:hypothetical protein
LPPRSGSLPVTYVLEEYSLPPPVKGSEYGEVASIWTGSVITVPVKLSDPVPLMVYPLPLMYVFVEIHESVPSLYS